ncbi:hypothetical protein [Micromonospora sp. NPDC004704]
MGVTVGYWADGYVVPVAPAAGGTTARPCEAGWTGRADPAAGGGPERCGPVGAGPVWLGAGGGTLARPGADRPPGGTWAACG